MFYPTNRAAAPFACLLALLFLSRATICSAGAEAVASGYNELGFRMINELSRETPQKNVFVSPLSLGTALSQLRNGASGETEKEFARVLNVPSPEEANEAYHAVAEAIHGPDNRTRCEMANSIWATTNISIKTNFLALTKSGFDAEITNVDFSSPATAKAMDDWASQHTGGTINHVAAPPSDGVALWLLSALYFEAPWNESFDAASPYEFTLGDSHRTTVPGISRTSDTPYFTNDTFEATILHYRGPWSLYVFLPRTNVNLATFQKTLTTSNWNRWAPQFKETKCHVTLPKMQFNGSFNFAAALEKIGLTTAFHARADFKNISDTRTWMSGLGQEFSLAVDERGTKLAVVTHGGVEYGSAVWPPPPPVPFIVNRPFFIVLRENTFGNILLMSSIWDPTPK